MSIELGEGEEVGTLAGLIEAQNQTDQAFKVFDVSGVFGVGGARVPKVAMVVPLPEEEDEAIVTAYNHVANLAKRLGGDGAEAAAKDLTLHERARSIEVLWRCCHVVTLDKDGQERPGKGFTFPGGDWLRRNVRTDRLAYLSNLLLLTRVDKTIGNIDAEKLDVILQALHEVFGTPDGPERLLAEFDRDVLIQVCALAAHRCVPAEANLLAVAKERDEAEEKLAEAMGREQQALRRISELEALLPTEAP